MSEEWPPEGTRVRIHESSLSQRLTGRLFGSIKLGNIRWVELDEPQGKYKHWPVERHEIEVIEQEGQQ